MTTCVDCGQPTKPGPGSARCKQCWDDRCGEHYEPRYSGPNRSGVCVCGCPWDSHHLGCVMNMGYAEQTGESYVPQECDAFGFNEVGGMKYNKETKEWEDHCHGYRDTMLQNVGTS